ncbi:MAG: metallophosphoesterase [Candidatus Electrothrix sp. YB6]
MHFFLIVSIVLLFMHFYLWLRLVRDPQFSPGVKKIGTWTVVLLYFSFPVSGFLVRQLPFRSSFPISWLVYLWLGSLTLFFFLFLFTDCLKILYHTIRCLLPGTRSLPDPERRRFLARTFAASASVLVFGTSAFGVKQCYTSARVNRFRIRLRELPHVFRGFTIVQISDIHIGEMLRAGDLAEIVGQVNRLRPDLIAITGDLVDGDVTLLRDEIAPLRELRTKQGIFFVTGNHEYYSGVDQWLPEIEKMGITVPKYQGGNPQRRSVVYPGRSQRSLCRAVRPQTRTGLRPGLAGH